MDFPLAALGSERENVFGGAQIASAPAGNRTVQPIVTVRFFPRASASAAPASSAN